MNAVSQPSLAILIGIVVACLIAYSAVIVTLYTRTVNGRRRRWVPLDYVWVPMGGLTIVVVLALWWHTR